ncbi:Hypothetical protein ZAZAV_494 [Cedratvirus Zaza IHUMI]|uniref:DUF5869 domain-containing protein n=1 Tax=Cedratvirus Zaza IHUMI TaxID=2126979 RepID=A0A2R8FFJ8_9VIRU|nr:Hypothetical protein ZAZAV_494 [Cedratvirus Zaza IHUMI]
MFEQIEEFPQLWYEVVHCQVHGDYSRYDMVEVCYERSLRVKSSQWKGVKTLVAGDLLMIKPYKLYQREKDLILQLKEGGNYFLLSSPYVWSACESCDEETESDFTIKEFASIYDLVWEFIHEEYLFYDQIILPQTYEELLEFSETDLEERLLFASDKSVQV